MTSELFSVAFFMAVAGVYGTATLSSSPVAVQLRVSQLEARTLP